MSSDANSWPHSNGTSHYPRASSPPADPLVTRMHQQQQQQQARQAEQRSVSNLSLNLSGSASSQPQEQKNGNNSPGGGGGYTVTTAVVGSLAWTMKVQEDNEHFLSTITDIRRQLSSLLATAQTVPPSPPRAARKLSIPPSPKPQPSSLADHVVIAEQKQQQALPPPSPGKNHRSFFSNGKTFMNFHKQPQSQTKSGNYKVSSNVPSSPKAHSKTPNAVPTQQPFLPFRRRASEPIISSSNNSNPGFDEIPPASLVPLFNINSTSKTNLVPIPSVVESRFIASRRRPSNQFHSEFQAIAESFSDSNPGGSPSPVITATAGTSGNSADTSSSDSSRGPSPPETGPKIHEHILSLYSSPTAYKSPFSEPHQRLSNRRPSPLSASASLGETRTIRKTYDTSSPLLANTGTGSSLDHFKFDRDSLKAKDKFGSFQDSMPPFSQMAEIEKSRRESFVHPWDKITDESNEAIDFFANFKPTNRNVPLNASSGQVSSNDSPPDTMVSPFNAPELYRLSEKLQDEVTTATSSPSSSEAVKDDDSPFTSPFSSLQNYMGDFLSPPSPKVMHPISSSHVSSSFVTQSVDEKVSPLAMIPHEKPNTVRPGAISPPTPRASLLSKQNQIQSKEVSSSQSKGAIPKASDTVAPFTFPSPAINAAAAAFMPSIQAFIANIAAAASYQAQNQSYGNIFGLNHVNSMQQILAQGALNQAQNHHASLHGPRPAVAAPPPAAPVHHSPPSPHFMLMNHAAIAAAAASAAATTSRPGSSSANASVAASATSHVASSAAAQAALAILAGGKVPSTAQVSPSFEFHPPSDLEQKAKEHREAASRHDDCESVYSITNFDCRPPANAIFSTKVFLGGVPWDMNNDDMMAVFKKFGAVTIQRPGKDVRLSRTCQAQEKAGYLYLIFDSDASVNLLLNSCIQEVSQGGLKFFYNLTSKSGKSKKVQVIPWNVSDSICIVNPTMQPDQTRTVFLGALHGMMNAAAVTRALTMIFGNIEYVSLDTDKYQYPTGSGRAMFTFHQDYANAVRAAFVRVKSDRFEKTIQIDQFLEDKDCYICHTAKGPVFCKDCHVDGRYYCQLCWNYVHMNEPYKSHQILMKSRGKELNRDSR